MPNEQGKKPALHKKHVARLQREQQQGRIILYAFIGMMTVVVLLLVYGYLDINYFQLQRPVAKVGDTEILAKQFEARVRLQRQQLLAQYSQYSQYAQFGLDVTTQLQQIEASLNSPSSIGQEVLDQMINEEIIRQEAIKRGIPVSEAELDELTQGSFGYFPSGSPTPSVTPTQFTLPDAPAEAFEIVTMTPIPSATPAAGTETSELANATATLATDTSATDTALTTGTPAATATLVPSVTPTATIELTATATPTVGPTSTITPTATPYTLEGYQTQVNDATDGLKKLGFGEDIYKSFFENQIMQNKLKDLITADITLTEEQVWARHILVQDESLAVSIIEKLKSGEDFATLAKELSEDTGSGANGGDLGWFGSGAMVAEFEAAVFALEKPGDITLAPVKSEFGFHIIQLIAKQERPLTSEQYEAARTRVFTDWLTAAREEYGVEIFDFWKERVPSEPNFATMAIEAGDEQNTALAEQEAQATDEPTATPK